MQIQHAGHVTAGEVIKPAVTDSQTDAAHVFGRVVLRIEILDVRGRRVAGGGANHLRGTGIRYESPGLFVWNTRDCKGQPVPSGCYWVRILPGRAPADSKPARQSIVSPVLILR